MKELIPHEESYRIMGASFEVYKEKGCGFGFQNECVQKMFSDSRTAGSGIAQMKSQGRTLSLCLSLCLLWLFGSWTSGAATNRQLRVGAARVDITPPEDAPVRLSGYGGRTEPFQGIHDRIYYRVIVGDDGNQTAAVIVGDVLGISHEFWGTMSQRIEEKTDIRPEGDYEFVRTDPVDIRLSVILINQIALCGVSGEVLTRIGRRLKSESPFAEILMITHANGSSGYLPDDDAYEHLSYEILVTRVQPGVEKIVVNGLLDMLNRM